MDINLMLINKKILYWYKLKPSTYPDGNLFRGGGAFLPLLIFTNCAPPAPD